MVSDDERREVARHLREAAKGNGWLDVDVCHALERVDGYDEKPLGEILADLIEPQEITEDTSDGYHTFKQLYYQRMKLFSVLVAEHIDRAWKTRRHEDGELCFGGGWFLVAIDTPNGTYGYHYEEKYWYMFGCDELPKAKPWDGYDERDVGRLMSLVGEPRSGQQDRTCHDVSGYDNIFQCSECRAKLRLFDEDSLEPVVTLAEGVGAMPKRCPGCGARITKVVDDDD